MLEQGHVCKVRTARPSEPLGRLLHGALDRAVMKQRSSTSIRFDRAQVLQRMGRDADALKDFRLIVRRERAHVDATREVRSYEMRARNRA